MYTPASAIRRMCTGKICRRGCMTTGGRFSNVSVSFPTMRAPDRMRNSAASRPGPGVDAANWLIKQGARIVGNDTLTFEQRPPIVESPQFQIFPVHMRLIADAGVYIVENLDLEELSAAKAYEFAVVVPPLKVKGGTGSAVRIFALLPR